MINQLYWWNNNIDENIDNIDEINIDENIDENSNCLKTLINSIDENSKNSKNLILMKTQNIVRADSVI